MSETYNKKQQNARLRREYRLRRFRQEFDKHGNKDTVQAQRVAEEAPRGSAEAEMGSVGDAPSVRQDGDGD